MAEDEKTGVDAPKEDATPQPKKQGRVAAAIGNVLLHISGQARQAAKLNKPPPPGYVRYMDHILKPERVEELKRFAEESNGVIEEWQYRSNIKEDDTTGHVEFNDHLSLFENNPNLTRIPDGITFKQLIVQNCPNFRYVGRINATEKARFTDLDSLEEISEGLETKSFKVSNCRALTRLPSLTCDTIEIGGRYDFLTPPTSTNFTCPQLEWLPNGLTVKERLTFFNSQLSYIPGDAQIECLDLNDSNYGLNYKFFHWLGVLKGTGAVKRIANSPIEVDSVLNETEEEFLRAAIAYNPMNAKEIRYNHAKFRHVDNWIQILEDAYAHLENEPLKAVREAFTGSTDSLNSIHDHFDMPEGATIAEQYFDDAEYVVLVWIDQLKKETVALQEQFKKGDAKKSRREMKEMTAQKQSMLKGVFPPWFLKKLEQRISGNKAAGAVQFLFDS